MLRLKPWLLILLFLGGVYYLNTQGLLQNILPPREKASSVAVGPEETAPPSPNPPKQLVSALGRLEPRGEIIKLASSEKDLVAKLLVKEGEKVRQGQELVHLEHYSERLEEIHRLTTQLEETRARLDAETQFGLNQISEREVRLKRLEEILPLQIATQEAEVRKLDAELNNAKLERNRLEELKARNTVSQQELDRQKLAVVTTQEQLTAAKARLEELNQSMVLDIELARSELETSRAELIKSQKAIQIESLEKELKVAQSRFERTIIRAPRNGEILEIIAWEGEMVDSDPILKMGNTGQMVVVAEVYESDVQWIKVGQEASVTSQAFSEAITGTVNQIGRLVGKNDVLDVDPASDTDSRVVEVKILLNESQRVSGLSNLQVDVAIHVES